MTRIMTTGLIGLLAATPLAAQTTTPPATPPTTSPTTSPAAAPAAAPNILDKAINQPGTNWQVYGATQKSRMGKTEGVPGNQAMRVEVSAKGANAWDVGAMSPIQKPIGAGDAVLVAVYMRAPALKPGETTDIAFVGATNTVEPYEPIAAAPAVVGREWKLYYASGKSPRAFAANTARVAVHLAGAKQVIELGPVFVLDFGPDYDLAKMPKTS